MSQVLKSLQDYVFTSKYARWNKDKQRRETWKEAVDRVRNMMLEFYHDKGIDDEINWAYDMMQRKRILGSQRALQFGGKPALKKHARIYNCFVDTTKFITSEGVRCFSSFNDGDKIKVLTHTGSWKNATVRSYGRQDVYKLHFQKNSNYFEVECSRNHRWLLEDGSVTDKIQVGDRLAKQKSIFQDFDFDSATPEEQLYWCYGMVYGDGTVSNNHSMIRLCGQDVKYKDRFIKMGFKSSSSLSIEGDVFCYTGKYLKTAPDPSKDSPELIRAFVRGYLDADGTKNKNKNGSLYNYIQSSDLHHINFIRTCFPVAGVFIISEEDLTGQETNFGVRPYTIKFRICDKTDGKTNAYAKLIGIEPTNKTEELWCLEVEDDKSFVLPNGIPTGNCVASYADRPRFFQEFFWLLLCGCGAGFSVQKHHVAKLPNLIREPQGETEVYVIPDTIEGWSDAIGILLTTFFQKECDPRFKSWLGKRVEFDYSLIRPKGAYLSSGVGKAPGPDGLKNSINKIRELLEKRVSRSHRLRPIDVYDICMHIADAVLSGGIRRSATIAVFSPDDMEMAQAKTGNWLTENPQRARSNNSALLVRNKTTKEEFNKLMQYVKEFGEPGFVWSDSTELIVNPCVEISFFTYDIVDEKKFNKWKKNRGHDPIECDPEEIGLKSGWQGCNLTTNNCANLKGDTTEEKAEYLLENIKASTIVGTLQAGFSEFPYLGETTENIFRREALLGVSMTGMMDNYEVVLDPNFQTLAAELCLKVNEDMANKIGINLAARAGCLKPEGTGSLVLGTTAHGCHAHHYTRYLRAVQANTDENVYQFFKTHNSSACEKSVWSANGTDDVIFFPIEVPDGAKTKNKLPAIEMLKIVKSTQQNWVMKAMRPERCIMPWLTHNVSNTINIVSEQEWEDVEKFIYDNRDYFCGISMVSGSVDKDYQQAPNCAVYTSRQIVKEYGEAAIWTSGLIELALGAYDKNLWSACTALLNDEYSPKDDYDININQERGLEIAYDRLVFYNRSRKFAAKYFDNDVKKLTYCMKDVYNWKRYCDLLNSFTTVDYTELIETQDNTKLEEEIACAGGACTL